jgi:hypothetical protein
MQLMNANVLDVESDALLLNVDGTKAGMEVIVARQFGRRWPEDWEHMARSIKYPIPLGRTLALSWTVDPPWRLFLFASTLHHLGALDETQKSAVVSRAFLGALTLCVKHGARSLSTVVLQGGWRFTSQQAIDAMWSPTVRAAVEHPGLRVYVCITH